jgi:hypothetical protein
MQSFLSKSWDFILALALSAVAAFCLDPHLLDKVSSEIVAFFAIQAAAIFPAMIFAAGILRPDGLRPRDIKNLGKALRSQLGFWSVLLILDFAAALLVVMGKAFNWYAPAPIQLLDSGKNYAPFWSALTVFCMSLALLRIISMVNGIFSLLDLNIEMTTRGVLSHNVPEDLEIKGIVSPKPFNDPEDYGRIIKH